MEGFLTTRGILEALRTTISTQEVCKDRTEVHVCEYHHRLADWELECERDDYKISDDQVALCSWEINDDWSWS